MKKSLIFFALFAHFTLEVRAQDMQSKNFYKDAFVEQLQMLKGERPLSFKRSVFLTEWAYYKGKLDYNEFCTNFQKIGIQLKSLIKQKNFDSYKTSGNWAVFSYMTDSLPINNFTPCTYDFEDFMGDADWTKMFVTKLIKQKSGNCHSLPYLYKILCEEIGADAFLALAPNHVYIKHKNETNQWTNVELTNGGFPRDEWIISQMAISIEAIKMGVFMEPLSPEESIAMTIFDLANCYVFQFGFDDFVSTIVDTGLLYFPKCLPLLMTKANSISAKLKQQRRI